MAKKAKTELTKRQKEALDYIIKCIEKDHRTPTIRQMGQAMKLRSTGSVRDLYAALTKKGYILREEGLARGIRLNPKLFTVDVVKK